MHGMRRRVDQNPSLSVEWNMPHRRTEFHSSHSGGADRAALFGAKPIKEGRTWPAAIERQHACWHNVSMRSGVGFFIIALACFGPLAASVAAAETIPLPRPRPVSAGPAASPPSVAAPNTLASRALPPVTQPKSREPELTACRLRLTRELAIVRSLPALEGAGDCAVPDVVRLEAVVLPDKSLVAVMPPATVRCSMAEEFVRWMRDDVVPAVQEVGAPLKGVEIYASYQCRPRNNIVGAKLSEHGRANAIDVHALKFGNGKAVVLTDSHAPRAIRQTLRKTVCERFATVLGPGSDGYHEDHIHMDLMERANHRFKMCQWDVRDPEAPAVAASPAPKPAPAASAAMATVPLPPPRPKIDAPKAARRL
jgi:hypothetical protein